MSEQFSFVSDDELKASLESDYRELLTALEGRAWKAALVVAGCITETVLVDCLLALSSESERSVLEAGLSKILDMARDKKIISEKAFQLGTVIKHYRNLIHPGKMLRLKEVADSESAAIAKALVDMIVREVESTREKSIGYTADQLLKKLHAIPV